MIMWSEKYRPNCLDDCVLSHLTDKQQALLKKAEASARIPNLLFLGPSGLGKTTIARILCDRERMTVRHFNGSDLGKHEIAKLKNSIPTRSLLHDRKCIAIDEFDGVTDEGQKSLRALIEWDVEDVSWVFTSNLRGKIINPIQSRMICVDFNPSGEAIPRYVAGAVERCQTILRAEGITNVGDDAVRKIVVDAYPDIRKVVNDIQVEFG